MEAQRATNGQAQHLHIVMDTRYCRNITEHDVTTHLQQSAASLDPVIHARLLQMLATGHLKILSEPSLMMMHRLTASRSDPSEPVLPVVEESAAWNL